MSRGNVKYRFYSLPMQQGLRVGKSSIERREGLLIRRGRDLADLCPLPGLSQETLKQAVQSETPSTAWSQYCLSKHPLRNGTLRPSVESAGLFTLNGPEPRSTDKLDIIKLKVGRNELSDEVAWIKDWSKISKLRLDGNRQLGIDDARRLADAAGSSLLFFEEPVGSRAELSLLLEELPIGLDESLLEPGAAELAPKAAALVLKPTLLGTEETLRWARIARSLNKTIVVSSCYESAVGRTALASFAQTWAPGVAHGLGTSSWFQRDIDVESIFEATFYSSIEEAHRHREEVV